MEVVKHDIMMLKANIESHAGMHALQSFGHVLKNKPLSASQLKVFFATLWAFYQTTPSGIVSLSLRINDMWHQKVNPWDAMEKAAYILSTSVDEFGLDQAHERFKQTHHQLFLRAAAHYGVTPNELLSEEMILSSGKEIGRLSSLFYREKSIAEGIGFHLASELTSHPEFQCFYDGFSQNKTHYQLVSNQDDGLKFFWVHTMVEPMHLSSSEKLIHAYLDVFPEQIDEMLKGAMIYMESYDALFKTLTSYML